MHKTKSSVLNSYFHLNAAARLPSKRLLNTFNAAQGLTCGGVQPTLEQVGWVLPQEGVLHILVGCVRRAEEPEPEPACPPARLLTRRTIYLCTKTITIN